MRSDGEHNPHNRPRSAGTRLHRSRDIVLQQGNMLHRGKSSQFVSYPGGVSTVNFAFALTDVHSVNRPYLGDLKPFMDVFSPKNIALHFLKAAIIPMNIIVNEFNNHTIQAQNKADDDVFEEFDWDESVKRNGALFLPTLQRVTTVAVIRKCYEALAMEYLPMKYVDKMTKDLTKSILRKCARFPRLVACQKILYTAFWGNLLFNLSCFTYDVAMHLWNEIYDLVRGTGVSKKALKRLANTSLFITKKMIYYAACTGSCAVGHAVGTFFNVQYGGTIGGFIFELVGSTTCVMLLD